MPKLELEVEDNDLVIIVPHAKDHPSYRTRVLVGNKPIGLLQEFTLAVGVDFPARVSAVFPPEEVLRPSPRLLTSMRAYQALLAQWTEEEGPRPPGLTLWERLDDE